MIKELVKLASALDAKGFVKEADKLDAIIRKMADYGEGKEGIREWGGRLLSKIQSAETERKKLTPLAYDAIIASGRPSKSKRDGFISSNGLESYIEDGMSLGEAAQNFDLTFYDLVSEFNPSLFYVENSWIDVFKLLDYPLSDTPEYSELSNSLSEAEEDSTIVQAADKWKREVIDQLPDVELYWSTIPTELKGSVGTYIDLIYEDIFGEIDKVGYAFEHDFQNPDETYQESFEDSMVPMGKKIEKVKDPLQEPYKSDRADRDSFYSEPELRDSDKEIENKYFPDRFFR